MNHAQYLALGDKAPINVIQLQVLACDAPTQTEKQAKAGLHSQFVHCVELEEGGPVTLRFIRGDMHFNDDMIGRKLIFSVGPEGNNLNKVIAPSGNPYIQINTGARIQPVPEAAPAAAPAAPAPAPAPAPTPAPVVTPAAVIPVPVIHAEPEPAPVPQEPELPEGYFHPALIRMARCQVICRKVAHQEFLAAGYEVSPDVLGGVATSMLIALDKKGLIDVVVEAAFQPNRSSAPPPLRQNQRRQRALWPTSLRRW